LDQSNPGIRWLTSLTIAWTIGGIDVLGVFVCAVFYVVNHHPVFNFLSTLAFSLFPLAGALIIAHQPRNAVGWLASAAGFVFLFSDLFYQYSYFSLILHGGALPLGGITAWISAWSWMAVYLVAAPFILLIPDGRPPSRPWLALIGAVLATNLPFLIYVAALVAPVDKVLLVRSQDEFTVLGSVGDQMMRVNSIWQPVQFVFLLLALAGLFVRFSRSRGIERQQIKWILLAITIIPLTVGLGIVTQFDMDPLVYDTYQVFNLLSACSFPISLVFAVTRYRLYDIDVIIRRTLVYSLLTFILGLMYFVSVLLFQAGFTLVIGQKSAFSVVLSTLVIAAAFTPLRQRVQVVIDRRFFRSRLDTDLLLKRYATRQRECVDLEQFNAQFLGLVEETLHPELVSLYLVKTAVPLKEELTSHS
jgi:hypothetical protein